MGKIEGNFVVSMEHKGLASYYAIGTYRMKSEEIVLYLDASGRSKHWDAPYLPIGFSDNYSHKPFTMRKYGYR